MRVYRWHLVLVGWLVVYTAGSWLATLTTYNRCIPIIRFRFTMDSFVFCCHLPVLPLLPYIMRVLGKQSINPVNVHHQISLLRYCLCFVTKATIASTSIGLTRWEWHAWLSASLCRCVIYVLDCILFLLSHHT